MSYFYHEGEAYIKCGQEPFYKTVYIPLNEVLQGDFFKLRFKPRPEYLIHAYMNDEANEIITNYRDKMAAQLIMLGSLVRGKKTKERTIGHIIEKVLEWRKLYTGIPNEKGVVNRYTLEEAATKVGIS